MSGNETHWLSAESTSLSGELNQQRQLWVLLFDELTFTDLGLPSVGRGISQEFQSRSVSFEQYYVQNLQASLHVTQALQAVLQPLNSLPAAVPSVVIQFDAVSGEDLAELRGVTALIHADSTAPADLRSAPEVQECQLCICLLPAARFLETELFEQLIRTIEAGSYGSDSVPPEILVTALRGRRSLPDTSAGPDESLMHVPLLYTGDRRNTDAVQGICGSEDLPLTIVDLLQINGTADEAAAADDSTAFSTDPLSLLQVMRAAEVTESRRLTIRGDHWTAYRTSDCLVWSPCTRHAALDTMDAAQLFLKPEDRWNRNDVSRAYAVMLEAVLSAGKRAEL